jgi:hypothetical protein
MARKRSKDKDGADQPVAEASHNGAAADVASESEESSGGGLGRVLLLLIAAAILAMVLSEDVRSKVLDMLFGAEEEFDYSSTTMPATDAPVGAASS